MGMDVDASAGATLYHGGGLSNIKQEQGDGKAGVSVEHNAQGRGGQRGKTFNRLAGSGAFTLYSAPLNIWFLSWRAGVNGE